MGKNPNSVVGGGGWNLKIHSSCTVLSSFTFSLVKLHLIYRIHDTCREKMGFSAVYSSSALKYSLTLFKLHLKSL